MPCEHSRVVPTHIALNLGIVIFVHSTFCLEPSESRFVQLKKKLSMTTLPPKCLLLQMEVESCNRKEVFFRAILKDQFDFSGQEGSCMLTFYLARSRLHRNTGSIKIPHRLYRVKHIPKKKQGKKDETIQGCSCPHLVCSCIYSAFFPSSKLNMGCLFITDSFGLLLPQISSNLARENTSLGYCFCHLASEHCT